MTSEPVNSISQRECLPTVVSPGRKGEGGREREERRGKEGSREGEKREGGKEGEKRKGKLHHYTDYNNYLLSTHKATFQIVEDLHSN